MLYGVTPPNGILRTLRIPQGAQMSSGDLPAETPNIGAIPVREVELFVREVPDPGSEVMAQEVAHPKDVIGEAGSVRVMLLDPDIRLVVRGQGELVVATSRDNELKVLPARLVTLGIFGPYARIEAKLKGHEVRQTRVWALSGPQNLPRKAEMAELDGETQAVGITASLLDEGGVISRE